MIFVCRGNTKHRHVSKWNIYLQVVGNHNWNTGGASEGHGWISPARNWAEFPNIGHRYDICGQSSASPANPDISISYSDCLSKGPSCRHGCSCTPGISWSIIDFSRRKSFTKRRRPGEIAKNRGTSSSQYGFVSTSWRVFNEPALDSCKEPSYCPLCSL